MKRLLVAVTLAIVVGSPALAQSDDPGIGNGDRDAALYRKDHTIQRGTPYHAHAQLRHFEPQRVEPANSGYVLRGKRGAGR
jgi:hypothetical protein